MIRSVKALRKYTIRAKDGEIGSADDFLFDDALWTVRYLVIDTGGWLIGRKIIIPPHLLGKPQWDDQIFPVDLTRGEIEDGPSLSEDEPVSRQHESRLHQYFGLQPWWVGGVPGGAFPTPFATQDGAQRNEPRKREQEAEDTPGEGDPHLRSAIEVKGYHIHAADGDIGHVEDFLVQDEKWVVRYLVADTRNWLPGRQVLLSLGWVTNVSWEESRVFVDVTREQVQNSPEFDPSTPLNRETEQMLFDYYGRTRYWESSS